MIGTPAQLRVAIADNEQLPHGPVQAARADQLVEVAEALGDRAALIEALQHQVEAYEFGGLLGRVLVPFARLLRLWDDDPAAFDSFATTGLHWQLKWVSGGLDVRPEVSLETIRHWLEELVARYRKAGYSLRPVYQRQHSLALHLGELDVARTFFDAWLTADRDEMADCDACELSTQGYWHLRSGQDAKALTTWEPVLDGNLSCAEEPHVVLAHSLLPLARCGDWSQARANHLAGYRLVRGNPSLRPSVGEHVEFLALTGNEARGWEVLVEHRSWLRDREISPWERKDFAEAVVLLLRRLVLLGQGGLRLPVVSSEPEEPGTVAELSTELEAEVTELAARFDARNGTTAVSRIARERLAQLPLIDHLPLGAPRGAWRPVPAAGADVEPASAGQASSVEDLLARAEALWALGDRDMETVDAALLAAHRLDPVDPTAAARARFLAARAYHRAGRVQPATALLELVLPHLEAHGDEQDRVAVHHLYGTCLHALSEPRDAAEHLLAAAALARQWTDQRPQAAIAHEAAAALDQAGLFVQAEEVYRQAAALWQELGDPGAALRATRATAWARLAIADDFAAAREILRMALDQAVEGLDGAEPDDDPVRQELRHELPETYRQTAQLLRQWPEGPDRPAGWAQDGLAAAEAAAEGFDRVGDDERSARAQLLAADFEFGPLSRAEAARDRIHRLRQLGHDRGDDDLVDECDDLLAWLAEQSADPR